MCHNLKRPKSYHFPITQNYLKTFLPLPELGRNFGAPNCLCIRHCDTSGPATWQFTSSLVMLSGRFWNAHNEETHWCCSPTHTRTHTQYVITWARISHQHASARSVTRGESKINKCLTRGEVVACVRMCECKYCARSVVGPIAVFYLNDTTYFTQVVYRWQLLLTCMFGRFALARTLKSGWDVDC